MRASWMVAAALAAASPVAAESWHAFSRSETMVYMADVDSIVVDGEVTSIRMARVSKRGEAGDLSHQTEIYRFRCAAGQWRSGGVAEYGPDGIETSTYDDAMEWEGVNERGISGYLKAIACDGSRANPPHFATLAAFVDAGRP